MNKIIEEMLSNLSMDTVSKLVTEVQSYLNDHLIPTIEAQPEAAPAATDYNAPYSHQLHGHWISPTDLRRYNQLMTEAIANEKWSDGFMFCVQVMAMLGKL